MVNETLIVTNLARKWLYERLKGKTQGIEVLPQQTSYGLVVWFYDEETWEDLPFFLTAPMVDELLSGKNPKRVKNKYRT